MCLFTREKNYLVINKARLNKVYSATEISRNIEIVCTCSRFSYQMFREQKS